MKSIEEFSSNAAAYNILIRHKITNNIIADIENRAI